MKIVSGSYYRWKKHPMSKQKFKNLKFTKEVKKSFENSKGAYGSLRAHGDLKSLGFSISRKQVARLMKEEGVKSKIRKQWKVTTNSSHKYPLTQNFTLTRANEVWVAYITYVKTNQRWIYLTMIIDLWDRALVGWSLSKTMFA
jgi:putative transposase